MTFNAVKKTLARVWTSFLAVLAAVCIFVSLAAPALFPVPAVPQTVATAMEQQQVDQNRRISALEAIQTEHRLSVIEVNTEEIRFELRGMLVGLGGLLVDVVVRVLRRSPA